MEKVEIKKNSWVAWSEDEVKLLKRLFPRGRAREIAEQTGRPLTVFLGSENQKKWHPFRFVFASFNFAITAPKPSS